MGSLAGKTAVIAGASGEANFGVAIARRLAAEGANVVVAGRRRDVLETTAGKQGHILAVDDSLLLSFGPRTPDLILQMAAAVDELMK